MIPFPSPDPTRDQRSRLYDVAGRSVPIADRCRDLALHSGARSFLHKRGDAPLARGASVLATVVALTIAVAPAGTEDGFETKVRFLRAYVGGLPDPHRAHVAAMVEAALAAEVARCMSMGRPPYGLRIGGWMDDVPTMPPPEICPMPPDVVELYAIAGTARIVDVALDLAIMIVGDLIVLPKTGARTEGAYTMLEQVSATLCAEPAASRAALEDSRATSMILWRTLRRRRPMAAAVIRARLLHDRWRLRAAACEDWS